MNVIEKHEFLDSLNWILSHMTGTKKPQHVRFFSLDQVGALREIRTPDPLVRSQVLYPAELWAHYQIIRYGGERGIRTLGTVTRTLP